MSPIQFGNITLAQKQRLQDLAESLLRVREATDRVSGVMTTIGIHGGLDVEYAKLGLIENALDEVQRGLYREWKGLAAVKDAAALYENNVRNAQGLIPGA